MKLAARAAAGIFAVMSLVFPGAAPVRAPDQGSVELQVEALFSGLISDREPGAAVLVVKDGRVAFNHGYGLADLRTRGRIDARTNFRLASVTKQFTAAAAMLLVRDGKLRYEDSLTGIFPDFPDYGRAITIRHLLNHTSGLPDYEDLMPLVAPRLSLEEVQIHDAGVLELLKKEEKGRFLPGSKWAYSNSGYVVLGLIVVKVSGLPYPDFLRDRIFSPLKMTTTVAYERGRNEVSNRAFGHIKEGDCWREADQSPTSATLGDGGIYSSVSDLLKWDEALRRNSLLSKPEMQLALTPVQVAGDPPKEPDGSPAEYGFGWFLNPWKGRARMWHYGESMGFRTAVQRFPDDGLTVIVLSNRTDIDARALALKAAELFLED